MTRGDFSCKAEETYTNSRQAFGKLKPGKDFEKPPLPWAYIMKLLFADIPGDVQNAYGVLFP